MKIKLPLLLVFMALFSSMAEMNAQDFLKKILKIIRLLMKVKFIRGKTCLLNLN